MDEDVKRNEEEEEDADGRETETDTQTAHQGSQTIDVVTWLRRRKERS